MTKSEFIKSMTANSDDYASTFARLYAGVIETNSLAGLHRENMSDTELASNVATYFKLRVEEGSEIFTALEEHNRTEVLDGLIDVLVVAGYEYYLLTGKIHKYFQAYEMKNLEDVLDGLQYYYNNPSFGALQLTLEYAEDALTMLNANIDMAVDEVLASNNSKFCLLTDFVNRVQLTSNQTLDDCIAHTINAIEEGGRYSGVYHKITKDSSGNDRISFWCTHDNGVAKNKYVKHKSYYFDADFEKCWYK